MRALRGRGTLPELAVLSALATWGICATSRNDQTLPGSPDFVLQEQKIIVFVHGCFFHGHDCPNVRPPKKNRQYYDAKIARNKERDIWCEAALLIAGWNVITVWECKMAEGLEKIKEALGLTANTGRCIIPI